VMKHLAKENHSKLHTFKASRAGAWYTQHNSFRGHSNLHAAVLTTSKVVGVTDNQSSKHVVAIAKAFS
jgi:hypothetical protein